MGSWLSVIMNPPKRIATTAKARAFCVSPPGRWKMRVPRAPRARRVASQVLSMHNDKGPRRREAGLPRVNSVRRPGLRRHDSQWSILQSSNYPADRNNSSSVEADNANWFFTNATGRSRTSQAAGARTDHQARTRG